MRKRITNNLALKILAFLIAAFLWLVVVNIDDPVEDIFQYPGAGNA